MLNGLKMKRTILYALLFGFAMHPSCGYAAAFESICCSRCFCNPCACDSGEWIEPREAQSNRWLVDGGLIYWRPLQNGLKDGCGPSPKDKWYSGYRVGFFDQRCSGWKINGYGTHLEGSAHRTNDEASLERSEWKLNYSTVDANIGYGFSGNSWVSGTAYLGVRGVYIQESYQSHFQERACDSSSFSHFDNLPFIEAIIDQDHKQSLWGIGPQIGVNGNLALGSIFSLYGQIGFGVLYGHFKFSARDFEDIFDPTDNGTTCIRRRVNACQTFANFSAGIQMAFSCGGCADLILRLGWEHQSYFNYNRLGGYGDLSLDGGVFSAGISF